MNRETRNQMKKTNEKNSYLINDSNSYNESNESNETNYYNYMNTNNKYGPCDEKKEMENSVMNHNLNMILKEVQVLTKRLIENDIDEEQAMDWKFTAMVIDRLCFIIFLAATLISTSLILFTAKNFWKFT